MPLLPDIATVVVAMKLREGVAAETFMYQAVRNDLLPKPIKLPHGGELANMHEELRELNAHGGRGAEQEPR